MNSSLANGTNSAAASVYVVFSVCPSSKNDTIAVAAPWIAFAVSIAAAYAHYRINSWLLTSKGVALMRAEATGALKNGTIFVGIVQPIIVTLFSAIGGAVGLDKIDIIYYDKLKLVIGAFLSGALAFSVPMLIDNTKSIEQIPVKRWVTASALWICAFLSVILQLSVLVTGLHCAATDAVPQSVKVLSRPWLILTQSVLGVVIVVVWYFELKSLHGLATIQSPTAVALYSSAALANVDEANAQLRTANDAVASIRKLFARAQIVMPDEPTRAGTAGGNSVGRRPDAPSSEVMIPMSQVAVALTFLISADRKLAEGNRSRADKTPYSKDPLPPASAALSTGLGNETVPGASAGTFAQAMAASRTDEEALRQRKVATRAVTDPQPMAGVFNPLEPTRWIPKILPVTEERVRIQTRRLAALALTSARNVRDAARAASKLADAVAAYASANAGYADLTINLHTVAVAMQHVRDADTLLGTAKANALAATVCLKGIRTLLPAAAADVDAEAANIAKGKTAFDAWVGEQFKMWMNSVGGIKLDISSVSGPLVFSQEADGPTVGAAAPIVPTRVAVASPENFVAFTALDAAAAPAAPFNPLAVYGQTHPNAAVQL